VTFVAFCPIFLDMVIPIPALFVVLILFNDDFPTDISTYTYDNNPLRLGMSTCHTAYFQSLFVPSPLFGLHGLLGPPFEELAGINKVSVPLQTEFRLPTWFLDSIHCPEKLLWKFFNFLEFLWARNAFSCVDLAMTVTNSHLFFAVF